MANSKEMHKLCQTCTKKCKMYKLNKDNRIVYCPDKEPINKRSKK